MGYGKWIGGIVGFMAMGPLGGLAGFAIGSLFDSASSLEQRKEETTADACAGQRNSFLFSLLVMALLILSVQTERSCTVKWSLSVSFFG